MHSFPSRFRFAPLASASFFLALGLVSSAFSQAFTAADSGWVRVFNGNNFDGFYSRLYAAPVTHPVDTSAFGILYPGTDTACIRVKTTTKKGEVGTDRADYSHYRTRMEYRFDVVSSGYNAGLLYGVDETKIRMQNNWPRGIEFQMQQSEPGSLYSIEQVTATTRATSGSYNPSGSVVQVCEYGCNARSYKGSPVIPSAVGTTPKWMRIELIQRGADSAIHIVNDTVVMKLWNIRIFNDSTKATGSTSSGQASASNFTPSGPYPQGALAVEGEGALISHRRWEIMEFPPSTPMSENFLHRLFLNRDSVWSPFGYTNQPIQWRGIGTIPYVRIEYRALDTNGVATGNWQAIVDSAPNTGAYVWNQWASKVTPTHPPRIRVRVAGTDWVWADSTDIRIEYGDLGIRPEWIRGDLAFSVLGQGTVLAGLVSGSRIEIRDAGGSLVRVLTLGEGSLSWDRLDARGQRVPSGMYFLRALHDGAAYRAGRALVL